VSDGSPQDSAELSSPSVSVVVCTYRREQTLRELLSDLLAQRDPEPQIVVVDQTPEHEPETAELLQRNAARLVHLRVEEPNLPNARNQGLAAATGDVVVFIDDDLRVPEDFLAGLAAQFQNSEVEAVAPLVVVEGERPQGAFTQRFYRFDDGWTSEERIQVPRVIGACMAYRRELVAALGGFEALLGRLNPSAAAEDYEFCGRWTRAGHRMWLAPQVQALHHMDAAGGCDMRGRPEPEALRQQLRGMTFLVLKEEQAFGRLSFRAVARLLRLGLVRRDVLASGPAGWLRAVTRLRHTVRDVREFWRLQAAEAQ